MPYYYNRPLRPAFVPRSDKELRRILRPFCVECGSVHQVINLAEASEQARRIVMQGKPKEAKAYFICVACEADLTE